MTVPTTAIQAIEACSLHGWPALETDLVGGWALRASEGYTRRANSANALAPDRPFPEIRAAAEAFYAARGLPPIFRVTPLSGEAADADLAAAGYRLANPSLVMAGPLALPLVAPPGVRLDTRPDATWRAGFAAASDVPPDQRAIHDRLLDAIAVETAFATVLDQAGTPVGFGLAALEAGHVGLFDLVVVPQARRQGAGRRLVSALLAWGETRGATTAYLQVAEGNAAARPLYASFGLKPVYPYWYRVR